MTSRTLLQSFVVQHCSYEASFAEVGHVIAGIKFESFLKPGIALENDATYGIDWSVVG